MKGGTSFVLAFVGWLFATSTLAQSSICDNFLDSTRVDEGFLALQVAPEEFIQNPDERSIEVYIPETGLTLAFSHLVGAEYLIEATRNWDDKISRGVAVYADGTFSGFLQQGQQRVKLDVGAVESQGPARYLVSLDGKCYQAEKPEAQQLF